MKVIEAFKGAVNAVRIGKEVIEAFGILLEDADHNGVPDVIDHIQKVVDRLSAFGKAHFAQAKKEAAEIKVELLKVKAKLDELRKEEKK